MKTSPGSLTEAVMVTLFTALVVAVMWGVGLILWAGWLALGLNVAHWFGWVNWL